MQIVAQIISGKHGEILIRQKNEETIELGELLIAESKEEKIILQVYDLHYGSQIPEKQLEFISGMNLEGYGSDLEFIEENLRNYILASVKSVAIVKEKNIFIPKKLPNFLNNIRRVKEDDFSFLGKPSNSIFLGNIRSGSKNLPVEVFLNGKEVFSHHILIPATTGRGKSNLMKVILFDSLQKNYCGILILDAHDEYYGRNSIGLKDNENAKSLVYYTSVSPPRNAISLIINLKDIKPWHFIGTVDLSSAQKDALWVYYNEFKDDWLEEIVKGTELEYKGVKAETLAVLRRRIDVVLGLRYEDEENGKIISRNKVFSQRGGETTIKDIVNSLENSKKVIIDTSVFSDEVELLIGSIILSNILEKHKKAKTEGKLDEKPIISVVLEEAPRVLSEDVLKSGNNIYSTIAREGRKFKIGLIAITQLSSVIPRTILANMNTKIILGNEMKPERDAIINSSAQDLSTEDRTIASLDKGEAIISSNFTKFAIPIKIPLFEDFAKVKKKEEKIVFVG